MTAYTTGLTITKECERLARIEHPTQRAKEARRVSRVLKEGERELAAITRGAVREMREAFGYSWTELGNELGVSRARAQQLAQ